MDLPRGDVYSEQQDFKMPGPWIPATPGKPVLVKRQHTAAAGANWLETAVGLPPVASFGGWAVQQAACQVGSSGSAGVPGRVLDLNSCEAAVVYQGGVSSGIISPQPTTPRKATPKPAGPGESTPGKRKYVPRKGLNSSSETSPSVLGGEAIKPHVKKARSARRHLHFSDELDKLASHGTTDRTQVQVASIPERNVGYSTGSSTSNGTSSTHVVKEGQGVDMNSSAGIALALNCSNNQILDGYLNSLHIPSLPLQHSRGHLRRNLIRENLKKLARIRDSMQVPNHEGTTKSEVQTGCQSTLGSLPNPTSDPNVLLKDRNVNPGI